MSTILLIHGAWGGAWVYDEVIQGLRAAGHRASAIDLPGHGLSAASQATMQSYVDRVRQQIESIEGQVVLGGHSLAGPVISQVAEQMPHKIESLVYISALLPLDGQSAMDLMQGDTGGWLLPRATHSEDGTYATLSEETVREVFLHDLPDEVRVEELATTFGMKQATEPFGAEAHLSQDRFGSVRKAYIRCERDRVISTALQDQMIAAWPIERVINLESGHFPMLSIADHLVDAINELAAKNPAVTA